MPIYHITHKSIETTVTKITALNKEDAEKAWEDGEGELVTSYQDGEIEIETEVAS